MNQDFSTSVPLPIGSIGHLLVETGRLTNDQAEIILEKQKKEKTRFGETGISLGFITQSDIDFALSRQFAFSYFEKDDDSFSRELVSAYDPYTPAAEKIRSIRGQITQRWLMTGNKCLSICSCDSDLSSTNIAANLAITFAQLGEKTLLIDADLRNPSIHNYFKLENKKGLSDILADRASIESIHVIEKLQSLSILTAGTKAPNPQELVSRTKFNQILDDLKGYFDVIILTTPPLNGFADAQIISAKTKGAVIVVNLNHTRFDIMKKAISDLKSASVNIIGTIVNSIK